jgi:nucleoside-diphosphate-sugar epimerase
MSDNVVLVTGASGFLASHIVLKLLSQGVSVRGSVRNTNKGDRIRKVLQKHGADTSRLSFVELDLMSDAGWQEAMRGVKFLIHTASPFITHLPKHEDDVIRPAVEGTRRALTTALSAGVERVVLTSSEVAVARGHVKSPERILTEADWSDVDAPGMTPYFKSKTLAEKAAWEIMEKANRLDDMTVINPGFILGPLLEEDFGTSGAIIRKMMRGQFPGAPDLYFSIIDVRDAADLHIKAMTDDRGFGHRVLASVSTVSFKQMAAILAEAFPQYAGKLPTRPLPNFVVRIVGLFDADARASVRMLGLSFELDNSLAEALLGHPLIEVRTAVTAMGQSLVDQNVL